VVSAICVLLLFQVTKMRQKCPVSASWFIHVVVSVMFVQVFFLQVDLKDSGNHKIIPDFLVTPVRFCQCLLDKKSLWTTKTDILHLAIYWSDCSMLNWSLNGSNRTRASAAEVSHALFKLRSVHWSNKCQWWRAYTARYSLTLLFCVIWQ
jgi:hypothetical protein